MPGAIATAYVEVRPDTSGFAKGVENEALGAVRTVGQAIASVQLGRTLVSSLGDANEAQKIGAQTAAAIRSTGSAANVTEGQVASLASRLSDVAAVDDDLIQKGANLLLTFTNIRNEAGKGNDIFDRATTTLVDMAAALGTDAPSAAIQLGKALNDPVQGITALTRVGVTFTEQQKDQIKSLAESGQAMEAQKLILDELNREFGGSAEAQATALDRINVASGNLKETVGGALAPVLERLVPIVQTGVEMFQQLPQPLQAVTIGLAGVAVAARPINEAISLARTLAGAVRTGAAATTVATTAQEANAVATAGAATATGAYTTATASATLAQRALNTAIGVGAAALGGYALGLGIVNKSRADSRESGDAMVEQLRNELAAAKDGGEFVAILNDRIEEYNAMVDDANTGADIFHNDDLAEATRRIGPFIDQQRQLATVMEAYVAKTGDAQHVTELFASRGEEAVRLLANGYTAEQAAMEIAVNAKAEAEERANQATQEHAQSMDEAKQEAAAYRAALKSLSDQLGTYHDRLFATTDLQAAWNESIDRLTASTAEHGHTLDLDTEAGRANYRAGRDLADALDALISRRFEETGSLQAAADAGNLYVEQLREQLREAGYTRQQIADLIEQYHLVADIGDISTRITLDTSQAVEALQAYQRSLTGVLPNSYEYDYASPYGGPRASGGPVYQGMAYTVGETGWETFVPAMNGRILSHEESMAMASGWGTGVTVNQTIQGHDWTLGEALDMAAYQLGWALTSRNDS